MPTPVVIKLKLPVTAGSADRVKSALVLVKLALPDVLAEVRVKALASVKAKSPPPVKANIKLLKLLVQAIEPVALRKLILALVAPKVIVRSVSINSLASTVKPADWVKPVVGITTLPVPVVVKFKVPLTLVSALRVKSAAVAVRLTSPPLLAELKVNALLSVKLNVAVPLKAKESAEKLLAMECTAELSRRVIEALVALNVRLRSVSKISLALIVKPAG